MPSSFLDIKDAGRDASKVSILPIPYEATTSYGKGTAKGPEAIIKASAQVEYFDEELKSQPLKIGIHTEKPVEFKEKTGEEAINLIERRADEIIGDGKFLIGLGGEHSITTGLVKAALKKYKDLFVVHFDAHSDMRNEYEGSKWSHASVMRRIDDLKVPYISIGIRSVSSEEYEYIKDREERYFYAYRIAADAGWMDTALSMVKGPVFLTFDVDALDAGVLPHTGTPEPGGLTWYQVMTFLKRLFKEKRVIGADVVELAPDASSRPSDFAVAKLVYKIIGYYSYFKK